MAYKVKGDVKTTNMLIQDKKPGFNITIKDKSEVYTADTNGEIELPIYAKDEINTMFGQLPLSQYGAINNNSVGVAGTFDGGSTVPYYAAMPVLLENDGSLVYLRPGTNGSTINYYYTYVNNPTGSIQPFTTIDRYYEGTWPNILFSASDTKTALIYEEVGNNKVHLVLTNGTMNKSSHKEAVVPRSSLPYYILNALVIGSYYYVISLYSSVYNVSNPVGIFYNRADPVQFYVYRIPVSEINSGTVSTIETVSGISGTTMFNDAVTSQNYIRIADAWASLNSDTTKSFLKFSGDTLDGIAFAPYTYSILGSCRAIYDGTNLRISFSSNCYVSNGTARYDTKYDFTVSLNINTKIYTSNVWNKAVQATGGQTGTITWDNPYTVNSNNIWGSDGAYSDSLGGCFYITSSGVQYFIREKYVLSDNYNIYMSQINNFTSLAEAYSYRGRSVTLKNTYAVYQDFASRVGDQMISGAPITSQKLIFSGTGTYQGKNYTKYNKGVSAIGTDRTYSYKSVSNGTISGFAPQAYRVQIPMETQNNFYTGLSFCDASNNVSYYGTAFIEDKPLTVGYKLNPDTLLFDKTLTMSNTLLQNLKNQILSAAGVSPQSSKIGLYYSPDQSFTKSIACIATANGSNGNMIMATVDCTANSTDVLSASLSSIFYNQINSNTVSILNDTEISRHAGLSCVKYGDFNYLSFMNLINVRVPGDSYEQSYCGIISGTTVTNVVMNKAYHANDLDTSAKDYSYIPGVGFGFYKNQNTDRGTKMIFRCCGSTRAEFINNMASATGVISDFVILAQDVIQGFFLYFTEITPVLMNGKYFQLPITAIDLSTIKANPGNTKFYIYVDSSTGTPSYKVSLTEIPESLTNMYIGWIKTDGTKVSDLDINKVSRFNIYRPSETQIGSAFPVSYGNPAQTGSIDW